MDINFLPGSKVAYIDNLVDEHICDELFELVRWTHDKGINSLLINKNPNEDFLLIDDKTTEESHNSFWENKNTYIEDLPYSYQMRAYEISKASNKAMELYLNVTENPVKTFRTIALDVVHIWKEQDSLEEHLDCFDFGIVYYLNDSSDWTGGDLYFPTLGQTLTPIKNRLLIIPNDVPHSVGSITSGLRGSMTHFVPLQTRD